jgi:hypothetical protein
MEIPLDDVTQVVDAVSVPASTDTAEAIATFQLPKAASNYALQISVGEAINYPTSVDVVLHSSLDGENYNLPLLDVSLNYAVGRSAGASTNNNYPSKYVQVSATNPDTIAHTVSVWVLPK